MRSVFILSTQNPWFRGGAIVLTGLSVRLLIDLIFALIYRNYPIIWQLSDYGQAIVLALVAVEGVRFIHRHLNRLIPWGVRMGLRLLIQCLFDTAWVLFVVLGIRNGVFRYLMHRHADFISLPNESIVALAVTTVTVLCVLTDLVIFLLRKWQYSLAELERFKKENLEFRWEMLKNQVNPHFLFNSLNTLSSLIYADRDTAAQFVRQLARVYRYVLEHREKEVVQLREELTFLQSYIYLMNLRLGHNLHIQMQIPEAVHHHYIAPLTLQMLIENAVKHNIVSQKKPLTVRIDCVQDEQLSVSNNLQLKPVKEYSTQIGLKNIRSRYAFITDQEVKIEQNERNFTVKIPLLKKAYESAYL